MKVLRTLYIPSVHGQYTVWTRQILPESDAADQVVQFGNLIGLREHARDGDRRSGSNMGILEIAAKRRRLDKWTQLIGPNEIAALNVPEEWTNERSRLLLRELWMGDNPLPVAAARGGRLLTHGGLTYGEWLAIGKPETADEAAELLNTRYARTLYQGPSYALGDAPNYAANPVWAHPSWELYPSWITAPESLPFDQVTGGGSLNNEEGRRLSDGESIYRFVDKLQYQRYGSRLEIRGQRITSLELGTEVDRRLTSLTRDRQLYLELVEL